MTDSLRGFRDAALASGPDWTGASIRIRIVGYVIDTRAVTAHAGKSITLDSGCSFYARGSWVAQVTIGPSRFLQPLVAR